LLGKPGFSGNLAAVRELYAAETWKMTQADSNRMEAFEFGYGEWYWSENYLERQNTNSEVSRRAYGNIKWETVNRANGF